jgi:filamentous hemagglutinin family protein
MKKSLLYGLILKSTLFFVLIQPFHATAQVSPGGLRTRVNGSAYATCTSGVCAISGGSKTGPNLLQRFKAFDTRNGISKVKIDTQGVKNVLVGITSESGTFLNKPLTLSSSANLFWLSPGGIWVGNGARVSNVNNLLFTTAIGMKIGGNTFNVFKTKESDLNSFIQSPDLNFADLGNPEKDISNLGLLGSGSIKFDGGEITVDRHLLLNASAGNLSTAPGFGTKLHAGRSVWLSGHQIDLRDVSITAGEPGRWGLVNVVGVPFQDATQKGSIQLNEAFLKGQQLWMTAGSISLNQSQLIAPKGRIQLTANNSSDPSKSLTIAGSVLDVSAYNLKDLNAPSLSLGDKSLRLSYPSIGLLSKGDIQVSQNTLFNASLDISSFLGDPWTATNLDLNSIADRSGVVFLSAEGKISVNSSIINADSSSTKAGKIFLLANGIDDKGGISINLSNILARNGAGDGEIILNSLGGIKLNESTIDVSSTKYPIFRGESSGLVDFRPRFKAYSIQPSFEGYYIQPYVFRGGNIILNNNSLFIPTQIYKSNLIATQTSTGGGLENPLINLRDVYRYDGVYVGQYGIFGKEDSFSIGVDFSTGGTISLSSKGGVKIADSALDASSGKYPYDYMGGKIIIFDESQSGISLSQASLSATVGSSIDASVKSVKPGGIFIQAKNNLKIDYSSFVANNQNTNVDPLFDVINSPYPFVSIYSEYGSISFLKSNLVSRPGNNS